MPDDHAMRRLLRALFDAALDAARAERVVPRHLPPPPAGRTLVLGAGKAGAPMAAAVAAHWPDDRPLSGLVIVPYGHAVPSGRVAVVEAAHPVPDQAGAAAARRMLDLAAGLGPDDLLLALLSGGGSALAAVPTEGVTLDDKRAVTRALLACSAAIDEINTVRKHLSAIKGGRLAAAAHPAPTWALAVSDVPGDDPAVIASGPTVADPTSFAQARAILARHRVAVPDRVAHCLARAADETPKPGDPRLAHARTSVIIRPADALAAAALVAEAAGFRPIMLGDAVEGRADAVARAHAGLALAHAAAGERVALLSGGELTVALRGPGTGGPNHEYALALALALDQASGIWALACDSDGIDGAATAAGAIVAPDTLARARQAGIDPAGALAANDTAPVFAALGDAVTTGPTLTNVNDFRAILIDVALR